MIELEDLKAHLRVTHDADDGYIAMLEEAAVAFLERETGMYFGEPEEYVATVVGMGGADIWLPYAPATLDYIDVVEREGPGAAETSVVMAEGNGFLVRGRRLTRKHGYYWTDGYEYDVTYQRGYEAGAAPMDLQLAVMQLVELAYRTGSAGMKSETIGGYSYTRADMDSIPLLQQTIAAYRAPVIA